MEPEHTELSIDRFPYDRLVLFEVAVGRKAAVGAPGASVPQRCTRGHVWDVGIRLVGFALDLTAFGLTEGREDFCYFCLRDLLREHCGRVKDR